MTVIYEPSFLRDYVGLPEVVRRPAEKQIRTLLQNPRHPSLRARKIQGSTDIYEARVTEAYRMTYKIVGETLRLRRIGTHEIYRSP